MLIADARLSRVATQLDAMKVQADRQKVGRNDLGVDISGSERGVNQSAVSADQMGDLAALAASLPGVQLIPGADGNPSGFSVLGLTADQNATTLNGMNFGGSNLPRDANVSTSLVTTPYDVARGNFSGGLLNVRSRPGSNYIVRSTSYNADAPQLQWTDAAARALGQQYRSLSVGGLLAGPIQFDKSFYSVAYQAGRRANDLQDLLNTDALGLETAGIAADSVARLLQILNRASVPTSVGGVPSNRFNDNASIFGTLDFAPPSSATGQAFNVTFSGSWNRQDPAGGSTTDLPSHMGERTNWYGGVQGRHSSYFGFGVLSETSLGLNHSNFFGSPFAALPNGVVQVNSTFPDGTPSVQSVAFGGNPSLNTGQSSTSAQGINTLSWFSENNKHKLKLTTELRRDEYSQDLTSNALGTFAFNSLADLDAGVPAAFTRQLSSSRRSESEYIAGTSLGDTYRPTDDLQLQYGVRLDGNHFNGGPVVNPAVEQEFGVSNTGVPNHIYASPRVGFSWTYGTANQISAFQGAARDPRAVIRGGIGIFQNTPSATSIGSAMDNTGLASAVQQLTCVGIAAPTPNWSTYMNDPGAIPTQCADGTTGTVFSSTAPNVILFDKNYAAPRALRSNLQWNGMTLGNRFAATIDGTYSLNLDQASTFDLNFNPVQQFSLPDEDGRPVYARATSIVPTTGAIGAGEARISPLFTHVSELRSDMESETRQLTVQFRPATFSSSYSWSLAYVYANARERYRGFTSTGGNPLDEAWGRSSFDSRHQFVYSLTYNAFDFIRLGWNGSFRSGLPYTPLVAGDINGDGYANDRAFIFNPAAVSGDTALASGMRSLLTGGSSSARACLLNQLGHIATRNSCQGPWSSTANLNFSFNPVKVRLPQRATLSFQISNPLGAVDALVHGPNDLHGWGQTFIPTSQLLFVRGFDADHRPVHVSGQPALWRDGTVPDGDAPAGDADRDVARRRRPDARTAGPHANARSGSHDGRHEGPRPDVQSVLRQRRRRQSHGGAPPRGGHARVDGTAGRQHCRAQSRLHDHARFDLDAGVEVPGIAAADLRSGRGVRPVSHGARSIGRRADQSCAGGARAAHARPVAQAADLSHAVSRHAIPGVGAVRHGGHWAWYEHAAGRDAIQRRRRRLARDDPDPAPIAGTYDHSFIDSHA